MIEKTCVICGKAFSVIPARSNTAKTCSNACRFVMQKTTRRAELNGRWKGGERTKTCQHCGKEFSWSGQPFVTWQATKFCSKPCIVAGQRRLRGSAHPKFNVDSRGRSKTTLQQMQWSAKVIARDGARCTKCGATDVELHAHHVKSYKDHPELRWDLENGITLCFRCHWDAHSQQQRKLPVNSVKPLTGEAEGNTEPSESRKVLEGVTTNGRAYRRIDTQCAWCGKQISRPFGHAKGKANLFCSKSCSARHRWSTAVIPYTSAGRESEDIV